MSSQSPPALADNRPDAMGRNKQWPKSAREALTRLYAGESLVPRNDQDVRRIITCSELIRFAKKLNCTSEFQWGQNQPSFETAFGNYDVAFWRWVWRLTPRNVTKKLDEARFSEPESPDNAATTGSARLKYLLWRAIFVAGMSAGKGYEASHYKHFAEMAHVAAMLGDDELFEVAKQRKWNWKKGKVQDRRSPMERELKYDLLVSWLVCGLWRMKTRAGQLDALEKFWPQMPAYSLEAIAMAQNRLGLRWFPNAS